MNTDINRGINSNTSCVHSCNWCEGDYVPRRIIALASPITHAFHPKRVRSCRLVLVRGVVVCLSWLFCEEILSSQERSKIVRVRGAFGPFPRMSIADYLGVTSYVPGVDGRHLALTTRLYGVLIYTRYLLLLYCSSTAAVLVLRYLQPEHFVLLLLVLMSSH